MNTQNDQQKFLELNTEWKEYSDKNKSKRQGKLNLKLSNEAKLFISDCMQKHGYNDESEALEHIVKKALSLLKLIPY